MKTLIKSIFTVLLIGFMHFSCNNKGDSDDKHLWEKAYNICETNLILDSHIDWPYVHLLFSEDISQQTTNGDFDFVRAKAGGLDAAGSVVYFESRSDIAQNRIMVDSLINLITGYAKRYPDKFALAFKPEDIIDNYNANLFSLPICLEDGTSIGKDLEYLKYLKDQGIIYITLNHFPTNQISDSNMDPNRKWDGLSPFGIDMIKEMNQLGIMIDISHSSDSSVFQSLRYSVAPIIASHSSCRHFIPGLERNLSDTLIKSIAAKDGIIMVDLCSFFLDSECFKPWEYLYFTWQDSTGIDLNSEEGIEYIHEYGKTHKLVSDSKKVVDHIEHVIDLVGIENVGIGSDYDGMLTAQPSDLPDVSSYPTIVYELLKRGYSEDDIKKILSGNFLRVWNDIIETSDSLNNI